MAKRRTAREREIDAEILRYESIIDTAKDTAKIRALEAITRLNKERNRIRQVRLAESKSNELERIDRLREVALSEGSFGPAAKLLEIGADLRVKLAEAAAQQAQEEMSELSVGELVEVIISAVETMPIDLVESIHDATTARMEAPEAL